MIRAFISLLILRVEIGTHICGIYSVKKCQSLFNAYFNFNGLKILHSSRALRSKATLMLWHMVIERKSTYKDNAKCDRVHYIHLYIMLSPYPMKHFILHTNLCDATHAPCMLKRTAEHERWKNGVQHLIFFFSIGTIFEIILIRANVTTYTRETRHILNTMKQMSSNSSNSSSKKEYMNMSSVA